MSTNAAKTRLAEASVEPANGWSPGTTKFYFVADCRLIESLRGKLCPACGHAKSPRQALCARDYRRLPREMQKALYRRIGSGYEEAFETAMNQLGIASVYWPEARR